MDKILKSLLPSDKPTKVKDEFVRRIIRSSDQPQSEKSIINMFQVTTEIILHARSEYETNACKDIYHSWAKHNRASFTEFFNRNTLLVLLGEAVPNSANIIWICHQSLRLLRRDNDRHFEEMCIIFERKIVEFIHNHPYYTVITAVCRMLGELPMCIPRGDTISKLCTSIISGVSTFEMPGDRHALLYVNDVSRVIGGFLGHILQRDIELTMRCLKYIFNIIEYVSDNDRDPQPSVALGGIVQHFPTDLIDRATMVVVGDSTIEDRRIKAALLRIIDWLQWPGAKNIDLWVISFLKGLAKVHKYTILIEVTEARVDKVFSLMAFPAVRENVFRVLSHMLLSFQHSAEAFHKIAEKVPEFVYRVKIELADPQLRQSVIAFLHKFTELLHCLMYLFQGFPELYSPILDAICDYPQPPPELIRLRLTQSKWSSQTSTSEKPSSISKWLKKSETGKTGLLNLGNTCFMNSVIQALYMCDSFRCDILNSEINTRQFLSYFLQQVFAFLSATQRAYYSPNNFLQKSRPSWFRPGCQQDCSEFLRYFIDQLHEQELSLLRQRHKDANGSPKSPGKEKFKWPSLSKKPSTPEPEPIFHNDKDKILGQTLVQRTFGGTAVNISKCLKCKTESYRNELFTDIPLAFPEELNGKQTGKHVVTNTRSAAAQVAQESAQSKPLALDDLIKYYLAPERLEGQNKYHCDKCKSLQDGERTLRIVQSPEYLIFTLLRFSFDIKTQTRSKIFTDVKYPKTLYLPVHDNNTSNQATLSKKTRTSRSPSLEHQEMYGLCAVVVHSGLSSDGGHYYTYARHSIPVKPDTKHVSSTSDVDYLQSKWYLFNDSRVSYSNYESFSNVTQKFAKDTAYVLVYKRLRPGDLAAGMASPNKSINVAVIDPPLSKPLREAVDRDNKLYLQEQELQERAKALRKQQTSNLPSWNNWKDDDNGPPGSCGGGGGFDGGSRLVF